MTILYIDDDAEDREFFVEAAGKIDDDLICYTAQDGAQALRELNEMIVMPDYIFLDVNMPIMNGKQFLHEIKKKVRLRSIPVVIYSTTTRPEECAAFLAAGAYKVIAKPSSIAHITQLIRSVVYHPAEY
ncbi:MAG TPA: response regulator [Chryseosolibacter sp.]|nr:response regulator [Chryseosolibacter sp.]